MESLTLHELYIQCAVDISKMSVAKGGFPVGAIIVCNDEIIAEGISNGKNEIDATSHAEIDAIRKASKILGRRNLNDATLYSSLEPCLMCLVAAYWAKIPTVVYACSKKRVSKQHYESDIDIEYVNQHFHKSRNLFHADSFEQCALDVIASWEKSLE